MYSYLYLSIPRYLSTVLNQDDFQLSTMFDKMSSILRSRRQNENSPSTKSSWVMLPKYWLMTLMGSIATLITGIAC